MCWRRYTMVSINGLLVLSWNGEIFIVTTVRVHHYPWFLGMWENSATAQHYTKKDSSIEEELMIWRATNVINKYLVDKTGYLSHLSTPSSSWSSCSPTFWTSMLAASFICAWIFHYWRWRSWKLTSLVILESVISSEIEYSIYKVEMEGSVVTVKNFRGNNKAENYVNLSSVCWLLSETSDATWAWKCIIYSDICIGFLRI